MAEKPLVSIVVPVHNDSKFVKEAISSIINQSYKNLEIIVVDDFSSDDTIKKILSFKDSRIKIIRNDSNMGAAYSRNIGIKNCTGEYISFMDGDDIWELDKTERQINFMISNNCDFSSCLYSFVDENGRSLGKYMSAPKKVTHKMFLKTDYIGCITSMYKKDIYPDLKIPDDIFKRNDYAMWLKLSEKVDCYTFSEVLAHHRNRSGSISSGKKISLIKYHSELFQKLYRFNRIKSTFYAVRNVFYYLVRRLFYVKRIKNAKI